MNIKTNYQEKRNEEKNGLELYFEEIPTPEERKELKENGFKWSNFNKCWYKSLRDPEAKKETTPDYNVKESNLYQLYKEEMQKIWKNNDKMVDYELKKVNYIVPLNNGDYFIIDKPTIEKSFCFGYSDCGQGQSFEEAQEAAEAADNEKYFMEKNLHDINRTIEEFETKRTPGSEYRGELKFYKSYKYSGGEELHQKAIRTYYSYETLDENGGLAKDQKYLKYTFEELTESEIEAIIAGYKEVKRQFVKRLNTYLKKYGTSKLHIWTYWLDE